MESVKTKIRFHAYVNKIEEKFVRTWVEGIGDKAEFKDVSIGWYLHLSGSWESIYIGKEKPSMVQGDQMIVTLEHA